MAHPLSILAGAGVGAGMMYLFDPNSGRRRRSLVRDQLRHSCSATSKSADVLRRDAGNRLHGLIAEVRHSFNHDRPSDEVLVDRVRSRIGRVVSHPSAIVVRAKDGCVRLSGIVSASDTRAASVASSSVMRHNAQARSFSITIFSSGITNNLGESKNFR